MSTVRWTTLVLALLALTACSTRTSTPDPFSSPASGGRAGGGDVRVNVQNVNFNDATIYVYAPGRRRLGRVSGNQNGEFRVSMQGFGDLYFEVDLVGGQRCTTRRIQVESGMRVALLIDSSPRPRADGLRRLCEVRQSR